MPSKNTPIPETLRLLPPFIPQRGNKSPEIIFILSEKTYCDCHFDMFYFLDIHYTFVIFSYLLDHLISNFDHSRQHDHLCLHKIFIIENEIPVYGINSSRPGACDYTGGNVHSTALLDIKHFNFS